MENLMNLSNMTYEALGDAVAIIEAYKEYGVPSDFYDNEVQLAYNENSGMVFLTNSDYEVAVYNEDTEELVSWYFCPYSGIEGVLDDIVEEYRNGNLEDEDDIDYLKSILENNNEYLLLSELFGDDEEEEEE